MFGERPSAKQVMGVSCRYLRSKEIELARDIDIYRMNHEDMNIVEVSQVTTSLASSAIWLFLSSPLQSRRQKFLQFAQEVEGRVPGEEMVEAFALNRSGRSQEYPLVKRMVQRQHFS